VLYPFGSPAPTPQTDTFSLSEREDNKEFQTMIAIPLGKIAVPTPGTPVAITLIPAQTALVPPNNCVHKIEVWPDPADTGVTKVLIGGVLVAGLPSPGTASGGHAEPYEIGHQGNSLPWAKFSIDNAVATNGPFVTLWVE
jgi:hypothetical protein